MTGQLMRATAMACVLGVPLGTARPMPKCSFLFT